MYINFRQFGLECFTSKCHDALIHACIYTVFCTIPWQMVPQGCAPAWLWCWTPRLTGHPDDSHTSPSPSADPRSPADVQEEPLTPK